MDIGARETHVHYDRKSQPTKPDSDATDEALVRNCSSNSVSVQLGFNDDNDDWGYCTEEQLEDVLLKKLESLYNEAIAKLVAMGYDNEIVLKAILRNGHCYGSMDALTNILHNTLGYLNSRASEGNLEDTKQVFANLKQLRDFSLACLVCLLRRVKPCLSRGDAMWCLLMCELHVGRASTMDIPVAPNPNGDDDGDGNCKNELSSPAINNMERGKGDSIGVNLASCRFHGGWGFQKRGSSDFLVKSSFSRTDSEDTPQKDVGCPNWPELTPTMNKLMKHNVALFAAEYRKNLKKKLVQSDGSSSLSDAGGEDHPCDYADENLDTLSVKNQEGTDMMLKKFRDLNLEGDSEFVPEDKKDETLLSLVHDINVLERQVKERKEWAHQKAMQAARKLSHDLRELKILRMERDENQQIKQGKPTAEDPTMKKLSEMETALRKASVQVDHANLAVRRLEVENAEIRAEMEASKLSASESVTMCLEIARREKKHLKKLLAWEKQRAKLQEDITAEKQKLIKAQEEMLQLETAKKTVEAKWREEEKAKERALAQVEEERRLKESTEANNKRNHEALRSKIELDFQCYKDDIQRLEHELSCIKTSTYPNRQSTILSVYDETYARLLHELDGLDENENGIDRECVICSKDEVSVVFLPCAHQVLCISCNDAFGTAKCPACRVPIEQRIRLFGASS